MGWRKGRGGGWGGGGGEWEGGENGVGGEVIVLIEWETGSIRSRRRSGPPFYVYYFAKTSFFKVQYSMFRKNIFNSNSSLNL